MKRESQYLKKNAKLFDKYNLQLNNRTFDFPKFEDFSLTNYLGKKRRRVPHVSCRRNLVSRNTWKNLRSQLKQKIEHRFLNKWNKTDKHKQHYSSVDVGHGVSSQILKANANFKWVKWEVIDVSIVVKKKPT
jgi:hypothetical protein